MGDAMSANKEIEADKKARNTVLQMTGWSEEGHREEVKHILKGLIEQKKSAEEHQKKLKAQADKKIKEHDEYLKEAERVYHQLELRISSLDTLIVTNTRELEEAGGKLDHSCGFGCGQPNI
eukprot:TRINITY_DN9032_c0_g1_i1.p1 TRINITY_DN9032_c0_g1~~TRINITY_DN9032_c0_g1_i1.p1  ORF type:complete len:121 (+),score=25.42 TRINITY_DN9032_c0_g1_i1:61-423(+)